MLQNTGLCVVADKLNFIRYLSHFRCVHRGAAFAKMRTTSVRKLLPESWGFLCPVHTPDGEPCGLMNHMTASCDIVAETLTTFSLPALLCSLGERAKDSAKSRFRCRSIWAPSCRLRRRDSGGRVSWESVCWLLPCCPGRSCSGLGGERVGSSRGGFTSRVQGNSTAKNVKSLRCKIFLI